MSLRGLVALGSCMSLYTPVAQQSQLCQSTYFHTLKRVYAVIVVRVDTMCLQCFSHVYNCTFFNLDIVIVYCCYPPPQRKSRTSVETT